MNEDTDVTNKETMLIVSLLVIIVIGVLFFIGCAPTYGFNHAGANGKNGTAGPAGARGSAGAPGQSCTVTTSEAGVLITCPDGSTALIPAHTQHEDSAHEGDQRD